MNRISIITVNRNNYAGLRKTIESVAKQTETPYEFIVIDGASTDGSSNLLEEYPNCITYSVSEPDKGIYNAMNKGVAAAHGEYCLFLNSGDYLYDDSALERILPHLDGTNLVIGKMLFLNNHHENSIPSQMSLLSLYIGTLPHQATFISRLLLVKHPYDEKYKIASDWKLWIESLVLDGVTYKVVDSIVSFYDCEGISSKNRKLAQTERGQILHELIPERILSDYTHFLHGMGYKETPYDRFYIQLRDSRYGKILYTLNKAIMRVASFFFRSARFATKITEH